MCMRVGVRARAVPFGEDCEYVEEHLSLVLCADMRADTRAGVCAGHGVVFRARGTHQGLGD